MVAVRVAFMLLMMGQHSVSVHAFTGGALAQPCDAVRWNVHTLHLKRTTRTNMQMRRGRGVRRAENVDGEIFVDETCINCDTCRYFLISFCFDETPGFMLPRTPMANVVMKFIVSFDVFRARFRRWMAPEIFTCTDGASVVFQQPKTEADLFRALQAAVACPTGSIRTETPQKVMRQVRASFPHPIPDASDIPEVTVHHNGFHSQKSYGAASYFITTGVGNVLVDSPRFFGQLERNIRALGAPDYMFFTHRDDVADHEQWSPPTYCRSLALYHLLAASLTTRRIAILVT